MNEHEPVVDVSERPVTVGCFVAYVVVTGNSTPTFRFGRVVEIRQRVDRHTKRVSNPLKVVAAEHSWSSGKWQLLNKGRPVQIGGRHQVESVLVVSEGYLPDGVKDLLNVNRTCKECGAEGSEDCDARVTHYHRK